MRVIEKLIRKFFSKKKNENPTVGGKTITEVIEKSLNETKHKIIESLDESEHVEIDLVGTPKMKVKPKKNKKSKK
jgi:hypothetical protein